MKTIVLRNMSMELRFLQTIPLSALAWTRTVLFHCHLVVFRMICSSEWWNRSLSIGSPTTQPQYKRLGWRAEDAEDGHSKDRMSEDLDGS